MARPTKIRQARSAEDFRDAVVERWRQIHRRAPRQLPAQDPDEPPPPQPRRLVGYPAPRRGLGRGIFDDDDDD